jgi:hypothetical protein
MDHANVTPPSFTGFRLRLGSRFSSLSAMLGIRSCAACEQRAHTLDAFTAHLQWPWDLSSNCQTFSGRCTGFGSRRCVTAPAALTPDSTVVEQCCNGWFQYPWITVCAGQRPTQGCGFCLW